MELTSLEKEELVRLLHKLEWPLDREVFYALMPRIVSVPMELVVLDSRDRVLLIYRKDQEFDGYHMPGTVLRNNESVPVALERLIKTELPDVKVSAPQNFGWLEITHGNTPGQNLTRHEVSLLWLARLEGAYHGKGVFKPLDSLPENLFSHHRLILQKAEGYLASKRPVLGA